MPYKCSVYGCKGNYDTGQKVSIFKFPDDTQLRKIWTSRTMRSNFTPTKHSRICKLHFRTEDVLYEAEFFCERSGKLFKSKFLHPRLKEGAVPVFLSKDTPKLLQHTVTTAREAPSKKRKRLEDTLLKKTEEKSKTEGEVIPEPEVLNSNPDLVIPVDHDLLVTSESDIVVKLDPASFVPPDPEYRYIECTPDYSQPGTSSNRKPDSSFVEDVSLAMTCEQFPCTDTKPDSSLVNIQIKVEPGEIVKEDILSATVERELCYLTSNFSEQSPNKEYSLFEPPVLIKEEPISSEEEL